jgi:hypothetical protein
MRKRTTRVELSGVIFPLGSDLNISEGLSPIAQSADMRRTVNGELLNVARPVLRKRRLTLGASDMRPAGIGHLFPGDYIEAVPSEPVSVTLPAPATSAQVPAGAVEVVGLSANGQLVQPTAQPASPRPLSATHSPARVAALRAPGPVTFPTAVVAVRFRPVLACRVVSVSAEATENAASASWTLELEEI